MELDQISAGRIVATAIDLSVNSERGFEVRPFVIEAQDTALSSSGFRLEPGSVHVLAATSGSFATELIYAIAGLIPALEQRLRPVGQGLAPRAINVRSGLHKTLFLNGADVLTFSARERARRVAMIFENPEWGFLCSTVEDDFSFSFFACGLVPPPLYTLRRYGLLEARSQAPEQLSGGEQQRLSCAPVMERSPEIVIGDFSSSNLDEDFRLNVLKPWVDRASADGVIFIFRGIDPSELPRVDGLLVVEGAQLSQLPSTRIAEHIESREGLARRLAAAIPRGLPASGSQPIVCADHVRAPYSKVDVTLSIAKGEILLLRGPNGSGKTSFGRSLVEERALPGLTMSPSASAGMALQNPEHMLFSATVERQANGDDNLIELCGIPTSDVTLQPLSLSRSKQKLLAIASACQVSGDLVILDEPTVGLDDIDYVRLGALIGHYPDKSFLIISHDSVVQSAAIQKGWKIHDVAEVI